MKEMKYSDNYGANDLQECAGMINVVSRVAIGNQKRVKQVTEVGITIGKNMTVWHKEMDENTYVNR